MSIIISKEELQKIVNALGEAPSKYVYEVIKFLESKLVESLNEVKNDGSQNAETDKT